MKKYTFQQIINYLDRISGTFEGATKDCLDIEMFQAAFFSAVQEGKEKGLSGEELNASADTAMLRLKEWVQCLTEYECHVLASQVMDTIQARASATLAARAMWYRCGLQAFELSHKLFAQFAVTTVSEELLKTLQLPWEAFVIRVPSKMLYFSMQLMEGMQEITDILVANATYMSGKKGLTFTCFGTGPALYIEPGETLFELLAPSTPVTTEVDLITKEEITTHAMDDVRSLVRNVIASLLLNLQSKDIVLKSGGRCKTTSTGRALAPKQNVHRCLMPVVIDVVDYVRRYSRKEFDDEKTIRHPRVRTLRIGHKRNQACGPWHSQRKLIFVRPCWVPNDMSLPVAVRPHRFREEGKARESDLSTDTPEKVEPGDGK